MRIFLFLFLPFISADLLATNNLPQPSEISHKDFLLGEWKPNAPSVVVFKDPFCPYCIKAIERKDELRDLNVFLFWYPIFGKKSDARVEEFFKCDYPVSSSVLNSVLQRKSPECSHDINKELFLLNKEMYDAYSPSGVPAYYFGGTKVSVAQLIEMEKARKSIPKKTLINGVTLDWDWYKENSIRNKGYTEKIGVYIPHTGIHRDKLEKLLQAIAVDQSYEWLVFISTRSEHIKKFCEAINSGCNDELRSRLQGNWEEIQLLFDLEKCLQIKILFKERIIDLDSLPDELKFIRL